VNETYPCPYDDPSAMTGMQRERSEAAIPQINATTWCTVSVLGGINPTLVHLNAAENQALDAFTMGGPGLVAVGSHDGPASDVDAAVWVDAP